MKKRIVIPAVGMLLIALFIPFVSEKMMLTEAFEKSSDLFVNADNMTISDNQTVPEVLEDKDGNEVKTTFDLDKNGVLLYSSSENASVELARKISGEFETEFRVYSDTHFYDTTGTDFNSPTIEINPYCDLQEIKFTFTDQNGKYFDLCITGGEKYNTITPAARVVINGNSFGYHYLNDNFIPSDTATKNASNYYTRIGGTTFTNVTRRGNTNTTDSMPVTIGFNPETMEIYTYHYGTVNYYREGIYRLIADLDSDDMGVNKLIDFSSDYQVKITFTELKENKTGKMLIYSINGQSLEGGSIVNNVGPNIQAELQTQAVVNQKYIVPEPSMFDLLTDVSSSFKAKVNITDDHDQNVALYYPNGQIITDGSYQKGCYFIPQKEGKLVLSYTGYDQDDLAGKEKNYELTCYATMPEVNYDFSQLQNNYLRTNRALHSALTIYPCLLSGNYLIQNEQYADVTLLYEGQVYQNIDSLSLREKKEIILEQSGTYTLQYGLTNHDELTKEFIFYVSDAYPDIELSMELADTYSYGSDFSMPTALITSGNTVKKGTGFLYDPDGIAVTSIHTQLNKIGQYTLIYMTRIDTTTYNFEYYFNVAHSSLNQFVNEKGITTEYGNTGSLFNEVINGIVVTGTKNDVFATYNKTIDLSANTKNDSLIELITLPSKQGTLDCWQYKIRLTDLYNSRNYIDITIFKGSWGNQWAYVKAGSSDQTLAGLEMNNVLTAYNTGTPINYSMTGESIFGTEILRLYYDHDERAIYVDNIKRPGYSYGNLVIDLDDPKYVSETTCWNGFTTGEVNLSLSFQYLQESQAQFLIKSINGVDFTDEWIKDYQAPSLIIDSLNYDLQEVPEGLVNHPYPLFQAKAFDAVDGKLSYTLRVYSQYQTINQQEVSVTDHSFIPLNEGIYTAVYTAKDSAGNVTQKTYDIFVYDSLTTLDYVLLEELPSALFVGTNLSLPSGYAVGGSGEVLIEQKLLGPSGEITLENDMIFIGTKGTYTLSYTLCDYLGQKRTLTFTMMADFSQTPIISDFIVPEVMIAGYEYDLSNFSALDYYSYAGIAKEATKKIEYIQNGVTKEITSPYRFIPETMSKQEDILLRFTATSLKDQYQSIKEVVVHLVNIFLSDTEFDLSQLFYQEQFDEVISTDKYVEYVTKEAEAKLIFANSLIADGFNFSFTVDKDKNQFKAIQVILKDSENEKEAISLQILKGESASSESKLQINDESNYALSSDFYQTTAYGFSFTYSSKSRSLIDGNTNVSIATIKKTMYGKIFNGFSSGKIKVELRLLDCIGESAIRINSISNQAITQDKQDRAKPLIYLKESIDYYAEIDDQIIVPAAVTADAVDPNAKLTVQVKNGNTILYEGSIQENYQFKPQNYGRYNIVYTAIDSNNRKTTLTYIITVKDRIKPTITLEGEMISQAKINETYVLPTAVVEDNNDADLPLYIFVLAPDGELRANQSGDYQFTPTKKGQYTITYYAQDTYNCYTYLSFTVQVS